MEKNVKITVANRDNGFVGYAIPELGINRTFAPREQKQIEFEELERLTFVPGGMEILADYLVIRNEEAAKELLPSIEPEYFYSDEQIKNLLLNGSLNELLDCLDFAPEGVLDLVKDYAVSLPVDNMSKREAILNKLNFDVTSAIKIQNTKFDGGNAATPEAKPAQRRTAVQTEVTQPQNPGRRAEAPKYNVVSK